MLISQYTLSQLEPAFSPHLATSRNVRLPYGGPYGVGGKFAKGLVLGCVGGSAAAEVRTLTITGSPTGSKITLTYTADKVYQETTANAASAHASVAQLQTVCDAIWGKGNVTVAGTPGTSFTLTFAGQLDKARIGGLLAVSAEFTAGTSPAIAHARTTPGSCGAGQFDKYLDAGTNNQPTTARAILVTDYLSDPGGGLVTDGLKTQQGFSPLAYFAGYFGVGDLTGLDANGVADTGWRIVEGTAITEDGAVVGLGV